MNNNFLKLLNIKSVCEIYCPEIKTGEELKFLEEFDLNKNPNSYFGLHFDEEIISKNRQFFRIEKDKFFTKINVVKEPIPKSDLIILNNLFDDLSKKDLWLVLANIKESKADYLMIEKSSSNRLNLAPFYLPNPEIIIPFPEINKSYGIYKLEKIAFLLDYEEDKDSELRSKIYELIQPDFNFWRKLFGDRLFIEFLTSYKSGFQTNIDFIARPQVHELLTINNNEGYNLRNHYYRILYQIELELVSKKWNFVNEQNFYKTYMIVMSYLNFFLLDPIYKIAE